MRRRPTTRNRFALLAAAVLVFFPAARALRASTAAFAGKVIAVQDPPRNDKNCLRRFTVRIGYLDYISWSKYGADTKAGETITRKVLRRGTVSILNGRLTNARTLAAAFAPGTWGYFYEDTWLDLFTMPDFQWGEVVAHDAANRQFTLRVHSTHKKIHLAANPPKEVVVGYDDDTAFRIEAKAADANAALKSGHWVQVHQARPQIVCVRTPESAFDPKQLLPHEQGRRGFANDLSAPAVLKAYKTRQPDKVIDLSAEVRVSRCLKGRWQDVTFNCRKTTFILDGKVSPIGIAFRPGRHAVLGHYRKETSPHKIFVRTFDGAVRGTVRSVGDDGTSIRVSVPGQEGRKADATETTVQLRPKARVQLNGRPAEKAEALRPGREVAVHPRRARTVIALPPY